MSNHLLIAGAGRSGTSFLVRLLHEVGLQTHLSKKWGDRDWVEDANAGYEEPLDPHSADWPYVVKSPWLYEAIDAVVESRRTIDGVILPMRDLLDAASSRSILEYQQMHRTAPWMARQRDTWGTWGTTPGGTVYSLLPLDQARVLAMGFFKVVHRLVDADIPIYFVAFPRMITDGAYLYDALRPCLPEDVTRDAFVAAHGRLADPDKIRVKGEPAEDAVTAENAALRRELTRLRERMASDTTRMSELSAELAELREVVRRDREQSIDEPPAVSFLSRLRNKLRA